MGINLDCFAFGGAKAGQISVQHLRRPISRQYPVNKGLKFGRTANGGVHRPYCRFPRIIPAILPDRQRIYRSERRFVGNALTKVRPFAVRFVVDANNRADLKQGKRPLATQPCLRMIRSDC